MHTRRGMSQSVAGTRCSVPYTRRVQHRQPTYKPQAVAIDLYAAETVGKATITVAEPNQQDVPSWDAVVSAAARAPSIGNATSNSLLSTPPGDTSAYAHSLAAGLWLNS